MWLFCRCALRECRRDRCADRRSKKEGRLGPENHPLVRPDTMEAEAVHRLLVIAKEADAPVMVVHLTNKKAFEEVMRARANGQEVYAETCPQYLLLDDSVYAKPDFQGAVYVCAPPIRKKKIRTVCGKRCHEKISRQ